MKTSEQYSLDELATRYGGWARLCDPRYDPTDTLYSELESAGLAKSHFDEMRNRQGMPARQRVMIDVAEDLLRIWARHLCGILTVEKGLFTGRFVALGRLSQLFLERNGQAIADYQLSAEELESFIQTCIAFDDSADSTSEYAAKRMAQIGSLARLCQQYRPQDPGDDPHFDPALVPLKPSPSSDSTSIALPIPTEKNDDTD